MTGNFIHAQKKVPYFGNINAINGYENEISGENIDYFSAFPDHATRALLTRTTDGEKTIEWETTKVPQKTLARIYISIGWYHILQAVVVVSAILICTSTIKKH